MLSNFHQSHVKFLRLRYQDFTFKEFTFLVEHGNVESLWLKDVNLVHENGEPVQLEEILGLMPKMITLE